MKKIFYIFFAIFPLLFSCEEKETEDISRITSVPHMELLGDNPVVLIKGTEYAEEGIYAELYTSGGDTISDIEYTIINDIDPDVAGSYKITYEVLNSEGIPFYINRSVVVADIEGYDVFELPTGSYTGVWSGSDGRTLGTGIQIQKLTTGIYSVSDLIAGLYAQYAGYGPDMAAPGVFVIDESGNIRSELGSSDGFGADVTTANVSFDSNTNTISYTVTIGGTYNWSYDVSLVLD